MQTADRPQRQFEASSNAEQALLRVVDGALIGILFVGPYLLGGRHTMGRFVFILFALVMACAWLAIGCLRRRGLWVRSPAEWLLLAGGLLVVAQIMPLPQSVLHQVSPHQAETLPLWSDGGATPLKLGTWNQVSLAPAETREGLAVFLAYSLIFLVTVQRIQSLADVMRLLRWIAMAAMLMAGFGLLQYLTSNGKFLWVYEHPFRTTSDVVKGSFANRNHFAHFLALGLGPLLFLVVSKLQATRGPLDRSAARQTLSAARGGVPLSLLLVALGVVLFAGLMTLSRGGAIAAAVAVTVCVGVYYCSSLLDKKYLAAAAGIGVVLLASLLVHGYDRVTDRLDDFAEGSMDDLDTSNARRMIWAANIETVKHFMLLGTGVGSHEHVYPLFLQEYFPVVFSHAESGYLQVASETGLVGFALLLAGIGLCVFWCGATLVRARSPQVLLCAGAVTASLAASVAHSVVDFVWYIPACMSLTVILAACAARLWQFSAGPEKAAAAVVEFPRPVWFALCVLLVLTSCWVVKDRFGPAVASLHWDQYLRESAQLTEYRKENPPVDTQSFVAHDDYTMDSTVNMIRHLDDVLRWDPQHTRANIRMAGQCLRRFEQLQQDSPNVMSLTDIREAAMVSEFPSRAALDEWLGRAIGENRKLLDQAAWHCRAALRLCPLLGQGYLYLAELCFLDGGNVATKTAYMAQALKVRPYDGTVLFAAGKEAILAGDIQTAIAYWKQSFQRGGDHQQRMIALLAGRIPFQFIDDNFEPDLPALRGLYLRYRQLNARDEMTAIAPRLSQAIAAQAEQAQGAQAADLWLEALDLYRRLSDTEQIAHCVSRALACNPNAYAVRFAAGEAMLELERYDEAAKHLRWCGQQKPGDATLQQMLAFALRGGPPQQRPAPTAVNQPPATQQPPLRR